MAVHAPVRAYTWERETEGREILAENGSEWAKAYARANVRRHAGTRAGTRACTHAWDARSCRSWLRLHAPHARGIARAKEPRGRSTTDWRAYGTCENSRNDQLYRDRFFVISIQISLVSTWNMIDRFEASLRTWKECRGIDSFYKSQILMAAFEYVNETFYRTQK